MTYRQGIRRSFSFPRHRKICGAQAYASVFAYKCRVEGALFQVYACPGAVSEARLGVIVSKRVIPKAVMRNFCKRMAREVFRTECETLGGVDVVVRPKAAVSRGNAAVAREEMRDLLLRARRKCLRRKSPGSDNSATTPA